jgi:UMF1 family MFS transporter
LFNVTIALTGSSRNAILSVILFFVVGALLLACVNVDAGRGAAEAAERVALGEAG